MLEIGYTPDLFDDQGNSTIEHYGVPGMKWGIRKDRESKGGKHGAPMSERQVRKIQRKRMKAEAKNRKKKQKAKLEAQKKKAAEEKKAAEREKLKAEVDKSTDPEFVYKHRSLLTDAELKTKLDRINMEKRLSDFRPKEADALKKADDFLKHAGSMADNVAKIYNAYSTITGEGKQKQKQKKNGGNNNNDSKKKDKDVGNVDRDDDTLGDRIQRRREQKKVQDSYKSLRKEVSTVLKDMGAKDVSKVFVRPDILNMPISEVQRAIDEADDSWTGNREDGRDKHNRK